MRFLGLISAICLLSLILTGKLRRYALTACLLDHPNHRSSHVRPTPRIGGIAIVLSFLVGMMGLYQMNLLSIEQLLGFAVPGFFVALLGFFDDVYSLSVRFRLGGQLGLCAVALYFLQGMPSLEILGFTLPSGYWLQGFALLYLMWLLNLYNFMDGIDGLAGVEALCVCMGGALLYALQDKVGYALLPLMVFAATVGFLYWNMPFARIFMGDAGSGFLGLLIGLLSIQAAQVQPALFWSWLILLGVFVVDATLTLFYRFIHGHALYEAHQSHAYQRLAMRFQRHWPVTLLVLAVNISWLWPLSLLVSLRYIDGFFGLLVAYTPLMGVVLWMINDKKI